MSDKILVVEDELDIRELILFHLQKNGYQTLDAGNGEKGLKLAQEEEPDLILLDLMLPGLSGMEICRRLREEGIETPILMLTAKSEEEDIVLGLERGADDYMTKPFSHKILLGRIKALLRRSKGGEAELYRFGDLVIDVDRVSVTLRGQALKLTITEFRILAALAAKKGMVLSRDRLIDAAHGQGHFVTDRAIDVQIVGLRKKLGDHSELVETVRGVGYRMKEVWP